MSSNGDSACMRDAAASLCELRGCQKSRQLAPREAVCALAD
jgi:hypothetical protein